MYSKRLNWLMLVFLLAGLVTFRLETPTVNAAPAFNDAGFGNTWNRVDKPVEERSAGLGRGYTWGPIIAGTESIKSEAYGNGTRTVQYFDKARMEVNNPQGNPNDRYYVTTGLLVKELVTGLRQDGDSKFTPAVPSREFVAGDPTANSSPTYADMRPYVSFTPGENSSPDLTGKLVGKLRTFDSAAPEERKNAFYDSVTKHNVPDVFMDYARTQGLIWDGSKFVNGAVYYDDDMLYVRGRPVSEAYWTDAIVGGVRKPVMLQLFERRVLTYTPSNPAGFKVEMGNVGQHYFRWRYGADPKIALQWEIGYNPYRLASQTAIASDSDGNTYIAGRNAFSAANIVNKYRSDNSLAAQFPLAPCLNDAKAVTVKKLVYSAAARQFYVLQQQDNSNCVQKYDAEFKLVANLVIGENFEGLAVDKTGNFYLLDKAARLVRKFDSNGKKLSEWSFQNDVPSVTPYGLAVDSSGNVYVLDISALDSAEKGRYRMQKFDANGKFLLKWNFGPDFASAPSGTTNNAFLTIDGADKVLVASVLQTKFNQLASTTTYGFDGQSVALQTSKPASYNAVDVTANSSSVHQVLAANEYKVYTYTSGSDTPGNWRFNDTANGELSEVKSLASGSQGETYIADSLNRRIQKFDSNGRFVSAISGDRLSNLTTDRQGNLFVIETMDESLKLSITERIRKFNSSGVELTSWTFDTRSPDKTSAMATDTANNLYMLNTKLLENKQRVQKFDNNGKFLQEWLVDNTAKSLAVDSQNNIYVSLEATREIVRYDANGTLLGSWKLTPITKSATPDSLRFTIDAENNLWIMGSVPDVIERYTLDGKPTGTWQLLSTLVNPIFITNLAATSDGGLLVATQNGRVLKYRLT